MAGITTLTGGAIARWFEIALYWLDIAGRTKELMSLVPLVRWTARPRAVRLSVRFERGVLTYGHDKWSSVQAG
ncbi:hypothetical protein GCM10009646_21620 [Streptomyces aureus]